jgi:hypothetical protein
MWYFKLTKIFNFYKLLINSFQNQLIKNLIPIWVYVIQSFFLQFSHVAPKVAGRQFNQIWLMRETGNLAILLHIGEP